MIEPIIEDGGSNIVAWRNPLTGEQHDSPNEFSAGAMWFAPWIEEWLKENRNWSHHYHLGPDGRVLIVHTPAGDWIIDSRCSNCDKKDDNIHHCWVRHGQAPDIHVDKNGNTCGAGAGSIQIGNWHGYLHNGFIGEEP